jgi:HD-GYP domain-containing protein (c-di-GMP phosphodiesterase class II)
VERSKEAARELLSVLAMDGVRLAESGQDTSQPSFRYSLQVTAGGLLHDIGKSRIRLAVLDKPGVLNETERDLVRKHAEFGYQIIKHWTEVDQETKEIVFHHHELLEGSGYPFGLSVDKTNMQVRLVTICDLHSVLTEQFAYKETLSQRQVIAEMSRMDTKIDQVLHRKFRSLILPPGRVRQSPESLTDKTHFQRITI